MDGVSTWSGCIISVKVTVFVNFVFFVHAHSSVHKLLDTLLDLFDQVLFDKTCPIVNVRYNIFMTIFLVDLSHHSHLRRIALQQSPFLSCRHWLAGSRHLADPTKTTSQSCSGSKRRCGEVAMVVMDKALARQKISLT